MKTPITDANTRKVTHSTFYNGRGYQAEIDVVDASVAQQLETELNEARAEIKMLSAVSDRDGELIDQKDQLIEQMREALCMADGLIDTLILDNTLSPSINAERMNIRAAIEAAERKNDDNQKL